MELLIIEALLWIGFGFLLWAMHDSMAHIEREVEFRGGRGRPSRAPRPGPHFAPLLPQQLFDPIGCYLGQTIYDYALIDGRRYRFTHICALPEALKLTRQQQWIPPGLVYTECALPVTAPSAA